MHFQILRELGLSDLESAIDSLISSVLLLGASLLMIMSLSFYRPRQSGYIFLIVWCIVISILWMTLSKFFLGLLLAEREQYLHFLSESVYVRLYLALPVMIATALLSMLWYNLEELREQESRKTDAEALTREAELLKLRQQLQPHFLFNSLNSISVLAGSDPEKARDMIYQLAEFLRGTLKKEEHAWTNLEDELQHLELYLEIEKVRFGHRLDTIVDPDAASLQAVLPPMILQPVVENAIKFGLYDTVGQVRIVIKTSMDESLLRISVTNPFDPETAAPNHGTGFGLRSLQRRLFLLFARNDLLTTKSKDKLFTTTIKIPQYDQGYNR